MAIHMDNLDNRAVSTYLFFIIVYVLLIINIIALPAWSEDLKKAAVSGLKDNSAGEVDIVAAVNGKAIMTGELLKQYNLYFIMSRLSRTYKEGLTVNSYLDYYISEQLLLNDAKNMGIKPGPDEVEKALQRYFKLYSLTEDVFMKWLNSKSLTMDDARGYIKNRLILSRLFTKKFGSKKISQEEITAYYRNHNDFFNNPAKIMASHILICHTESQGCESSLSKIEAKELAYKIRKTITPENFAESAKKYSYDSTSQIGGSLGVITKGSAIPALDKAAFSLKIGEISDPVESEHGYHILYVTNKAEELSISPEDAKESIEYTLEEDLITSELLKYAEQIKKNTKIIKYSGADRKSSSDLKELANNKKAAPDVKQYSTFKATGKDIYRNSKGQPVILMFSHKGCPFCKWIEDTFDDLVMEYIRKGLIEAHHYDFQTKDDLLTPVTETEIPENYSDFFPNKGTPYFFFGGMYERYGDGYFDQDDLYAEEMEMRQVIDDLIRY